MLTAISAETAFALILSPPLSTTLSDVQDPHALEDLTGLTELHNSAAALMMDASDEEQDEDESLLRPQHTQQAPASSADDWLEL